MHTYMYVGKDTLLLPHLTLRKELGLLEILPNSNYNPSKLSKIFNYLYPI